MTVKFSNNFDEMVSQLSQVESSTNQNLTDILNFFDVALSSSQIGLIVYMESATSGWKNTTSVKISTIKSYGFTDNEAYTIIQETNLLIQLPGYPIDGRQYAFGDMVSQFKVIESGYKVGSFSWYYNYVGNAMIQGNDDPKITVLKIFRPPAIVDITSETYSKLSLYPSRGTIEFLRSNTYLSTTSTYNPTNYEVGLWPLLTSGQTQEIIQQYLESISSPEAYKLSVFAQAVYSLVKESRIKANEVNTFAALTLGYDYDAFRTLYDGPETQLSIIASLNSLGVQKVLLSAVRNIILNKSIVDYVGIEQSIQGTFPNGIELNYSAALCTIVMFGKINVEKPNTVTQDYVRNFITSNYYINNFPQFLFDGVYPELVGLQTQSLSLGNPQYITSSPFSNLSSSDIIALVGIGVGLTTCYLINNKKGISAKNMSESFDAIKSIIVDVAISSIVLVTFTEVAIIYSQQKSVSGTIGVIVADFIKVLINAFIDTIEDVWSSLKGEWAKFIAVIGSGAAIIAGGEAIIGKDLIAGASEIEEGEIIQGEEQEAGDVEEGLEEGIGDIIP